MTIKIYFVEKSIPFNINDLNNNYIGGAEKILIADLFDKDNYKLLDTYGWINYKLGNYNKALDYINKSLFIKRDSMALEHLIKVLKITNKSNQIEEIQSDFFDSK